jgi:hypothetical protein
MGVPLAEEGKMDTICGHRPLEGAAVSAGSVTQIAYLPFQSSMRTIALEGRCVVLSTCPSSIGQGGDSNAIAESGEGKRLCSD